MGKLDIKNPFQPRNPSPSEKEELLCFFEGLAFLDEPMVLLSAPASSPGPQACSPGKGARGTIL